MKFFIKSPCEGCPFRRDVHGFLNPARARALANSLKRDDYTWFACHQTTSEGTNRRVKKSDQSMCMGSMRVLWKAGLANVGMRIALATGLLQAVDLEREKPPTFDTLEEFAGHHGP